MTITDPIRDKKNVKKLADYYLQNGQIRNYALMVMGIHTALRISDMLRLTWKDVYDLETDCPLSHVRVTEKKTKKNKTIALNGAIKRALCMLRAQKQSAELSGFLFENNRKEPSAISRVQAYRIIKAAADSLGISGHISCHSLRKTFGYHAWKKGVSPVMIMDIYNHSSFEVTKRYLGVSQDDRDSVYLQMSLI